MSDDDKGFGLGIVQSSNIFSENRQRLLPQGDTGKAFTCHAIDSGGYFFAVEADECGVNVPEFVAIVTIGDRFKFSTATHNVKNLFPFGWLYAFLVLVVILGKIGYSDIFIGCIGTGRTVICDIRRRLDVVVFHSVERPELTLVIRNGFIAKACHTQSLGHINQEGFVTERTSVIGYLSQRLNYRITYTDAFAHQSVGNCHVYITFQIRDVWNDVVSID